MHIPAGYPVDAISQLIQNNADFYRFAFPMEEVVDISSRFHETDVISLCEADERIEVPTQLKRSSDDTMLFIAHDFKNPHGLQQQIRTVRCR